MKILFWKYLKRYRGLLILALVLATINQVFSLLDPQITRLIIDNYATKAGELEREVFIKGVGLLLLAFVGVALVSRIAKNFQDYYVNVIKQKVGTEMYADSVEHAFRMPYGVFEDRQSGEILEKMKKAREDFQDLIMQMINAVFVSLVGFTFVIIYGFTVHWRIALAYLLTLPFIGGIMFAISKKIRKAQKDIVKETSELAGATTETLRNVQLVKSLGLEEQEVRRLNKVNEKILGLELKKVKLIRMFEFIQGTIINGIRALLLFLMLYLLYQGNVTIGEFLALFFYSFFVFAPLAGVGMVISKYQEAKASNEQLQEILSTPMEQKPKDAVTLNGLEEIKFENVGFSYSKDLDSSLKDVSLKIEKGESVAFVGLSGSGKTTLIKLILGLYDSSKGKVSFNGIDSKKIDYESLRKRIGLVSQETQLFAGTIKENLLFVKPHATDEECLKALKDAAAMSILERGGKGLNTKIGEGGIKVSGGERQRLAITRALLRNPDLIIFDEATSSLDSITEKSITQTIREIAKSRPNLMSILVAHRLSTIDHADTIYVLEKGKVIEHGTHKALLGKHGLYAALWREQSGGTS